MGVRTRTIAGIVIALAGALVAPSFAAEPSARIVEYGRYKGTVVSLTPADGVSGSVSVQSKEITHLETTKKIPPKIGELFGFRVEFAGLPTERPYKIRNEVHHPPIKQPDGETLTKSVTETRLQAGAVPYDFYAWHFLKGFEYELVPGKWTRKIFVDDKEVATMTFEVLQ
jgi:hypothetical protein